MESAVKMKSKFNVWIALLLPVLAQASGLGREGNGGDAYLVNGKLYSLDLVEAGLERSAFIDQKVRADEETLALLDKKFGNTNGVPKILIAKKMTELKSRSMGYYRSLLLALNHYEWRFLQADLKDINDATSSVALDPKKMIQVAIRFQNTIQIHSPSFLKLDLLNRTALIFHELTYSFSYTPRFLVNGWDTHKFNLNSNNARKLVQLIFDPSPLAKTTNLSKAANPLVDAPILDFDTAAAQNPGQLPTFHLAQQKLYILPETAECFDSYLSVFNSVNADSDYPVLGDWWERCLRKAYLDGNYALGFYLKDQKN